jgi:hypothetical protein
MIMFVFFYVMDSNYSICSSMQVVEKPVENKNNNNGGQGPAQQQQQQEAVRWEIFPPSGSILGSCAMMSSHGTFIRAQPNGQVDLQEEAGMIVFWLFFFF